MPKTLAQWLSWQETLHPGEIDLGLDRISAVHARLLPCPPAHPVITVGGTNGKGSSVAMLEAILRAAGYRVGSYTSPHLQRYNERVCIDGQPVSDAELCGAFERIDRARSDVSLTYFEFGTLAALDIFSTADLDVVLLEVGLGGRLDAVNIIDADVALITTVDVDHVQWLGSDREAIGREKAGIFRSGCPAVYADREPPRSLLEYAEEIGCRLYCLDRDYHHVMEQAGGQWHWSGPVREFSQLPLPSLPGAHQLQNAAGVLMALDTVASRLPVSEEAVRSGMKNVRLPGRQQHRVGTVEEILDVAHNRQSVAMLAEALRKKPATGRTLAVLGILVDKDIHGMLAEISGMIEHWFVARLDSPRGADGTQLAKILRELAVPEEKITVSTGIADALAAARQAARMGDQIVIFGSFHTVAAALGGAV